MLTMTQKCIQAPNNEPKKLKLTKNQSNLVSTMILSVYTFIFVILNLPQLNSSQPATDVRIVFADTSKDRFKACHDGYDGALMMRWVKAGGFDYFDDVDLTWTGTGVNRAVRGQGCLLVVPDQWYWMAFVSTRTNTTHCHLNATLRETTAPDGGVCDPLTAGKSLWKKLWNDEREFFKNGADQNFSLNHGYGQEYVLTHGDYDLNGKNLAWLVDGMKYWHSTSPFYLDHIEGTALTNIILENAHIEFRDIYERMIKHEHLGMAVDHIPYKFYIADQLNALPSIFSYSDEFILKTVQDFEYTLPTPGKRNMVFSYSTYAAGDLVALWTITIRYDDVLFKYIADISVDLSSSILTGSIQVDSPGTEYLSFFVSFGPAPLGGNLNNIKYYANLKLTNGAQTVSWSDSASKTVIGIWTKKLYVDISQECDDVTAVANCSMTHDFGLTHVTHGRFSGSIDREDIPNNLWVSTDPGHDSKCWSAGTSIPDLFLTKCNHCKAVRSANPDGTLEYRLQNEDFYCVNSFSNPTAIPKLNDCEIAYGAKSESCDRCKDNFAHNIAYTQ